MKRIKIWINSLNLLEQFLMISFLTILLFVGFFVSFVDQRIDDLTNEQMYQYLHRSQNDFMSATENMRIFEDANVYHYVYSKVRNAYISEISPDIQSDLALINPISNEPIKDGMIENGRKYIVYSIRNFENDYALVSVIRNEYRLEFRESFLGGTVNITIVMMMSLFLLFMIWIMSLIKPLNQIRNYIYRLRVGDNVDLIVNRRDEIGEVAEALKEMNIELRHQQKIREEMIQNISHDLKTPIATIKSYSESIKDGIYPYETLEKSVDVIIEHAERLENKVHSLIRLNKYGYMQDTSEGDQLYMPDVVKKAILSCKVLRNEIHIETNLDNKAYFHGEEEPWRVVIENLLENGIRYAETVVKIKVAPDLLEISNDGKPMTADRIDKLFKPYEKGTKGNFGLGLSIVKKVTETYGYNVTGENMGDGVVFRVYRDRKKRGR